MKQVLAQHISQKYKIGTDDSEASHRGSYLITKKHYDLVKNDINKLLNAQVICSSHSSLSVSIIVVPKGNSGKHLVTDYRALHKVTKKFVWTMPKVKIFLKNKWC